MNNQRTIITANHLLQTLAIDSILGVLSWYERATIHQFFNNKFSPENFSKRVDKLAGLIAENSITAPEMNIGQDRLTYYLQEFKECAFLDLQNEWLPIEEYQRYHPEIVEQIKNLKYD